MKSISIFNNKGGVGKTTLTYHIGHALAESGKKVLMIDLDPQCNLTIISMEEEELHEIWKEEDPFIDSFDDAKNGMSENDFNILMSKPKTIHYLLKPTEEGTADHTKLSPPKKISNNLDLIPGRLTTYYYEDILSKRWSEIYQGDALAIRTISKIRDITQAYGNIHGYDIVIIDTSPSLGMLNKTIISTVDGFLVPCSPDMFSLYGIRNLGNALAKWKQEINVIQQVVTPAKLKGLTINFVQFLGYTIYNAKRYKNITPWNLSKAHYNYAQQIPETVEKFIQEDVRSHLSNDLTKEPIGGQSVMHSHNTLPNMAQKYKQPIWNIPSISALEKEDITTIKGNRGRYEITKEGYSNFIEDLLTRIDTLD